LARELLHVYAKTQGTASRHPRKVQIMSISRRLSALLVTAALTFAGPMAGFAVRATGGLATTARESASTPSSAPTPASDAEQYAAREAGNESVEAFQGGDVVVIGGSALAVVLIVLLIIVLL
jgi:hypothetical protein